MILLLSALAEASLFLELVTGGQTIIPSERPRLNFEPSFGPNSTFPSYAFGDICCQPSEWIFGNVANFCSYGLRMNTGFHDRELQ
jgi:hypothetical protein